MATLIDTRNAPVFLDNMTVARTTDIRFYFNDPNPLLKPPTMSRFAYPKASALHFENTLVSCSTATLATHYRLHSYATTVMGPYTVSQERYCEVVHDPAIDDEGFTITVLPSEPKGLKVVRHENAHEPFIEFVTGFERFAKSKSVFTSGQSIHYRLCAVGSPFFYPLNHSDVKTIKDNTPRSKSHVRYIHNKLVAQWQVIARTIDDGAKPEIFDGKVLDMTLKGEDECIIKPNSIIGRMIRTLSTRDTDGMLDTSAAFVRRVNDQDKDPKITIRNGH
ncbi:hypothetical protein SEA_FORZA_118 [Gordonia phage Forza]|uniref:Uncharacterized protein n=1 Tax=Gordonia phage Forza TaxID=2571247 RepID=A0A650F0M1_9CAUD|nr:hypothetical protein PP303_gp118 [Gordonia phage Forza]QEM41585.1 hypothetical protein SEA_BOOPY_118 [Gordonia phage Boopy]QGT55111.1 hypothetical protein SEA_FORZA_118 [Gordonia phage Forza]UXE04259.1 hypothetical protein SEA_BLUENGOLD_117 [Gordonia phage BlueNGold]WBF03899.1 hypothetical protein SEA_MAREELIH_116 [Gordonia phage Mareelih]